MLNLEPRMDVMEENIDRLETLFGHFMAQTGAILKRMERDRAEEAKIWQERSEKLEQHLANITQQMADSDAKWERRFADSQAQWKKELAADRKHWNKRWGELADKMGTIPEDIVVPNIPRLAKHHFGCEAIEDFMVRRKIRNKTDPTKRREFDVIAVCEDKVIINETKSTPSVEYIDKFIHAVEEIEDYFPEYRGKTIIPIFASLYMGEDIINYLTKKRIYAMAMGDETMELLNGKTVTLALPK